jgi:hypothetical protein
MSFRGDTRRASAFKSILAINPDGRGPFDITADRFFIINRVVNYFGLDAQFLKSAVYVLAELVIRAADLGHVDVDIHPM